MQKPQDMEPIKENEEGLSALSSSLVREDETAELDNLTECNHWASVYQGPLTQALQQLVTKESLSKVKVILVPMSRTKKWRKRDLVKNVKDRIITRTFRVE